MATQRDAVSIGDVIPEKMCLSSADIDVVAATALTDGGVVASLALPQSSCTGGTSGKGSDLREYTSISPIPRRSVALDEDAAVLSNGVNLQLRARRHSLTNANDPSSWYKLHQVNVIDSVYASLTMATCFKSVVTSCSLGSCWAKVHSVKSGVRWTESPAGNWLSRFTRVPN